MKKLYVYNNNVWEVIDETQTHYVCAPKSTTEGYGYIPKDKSITLEEKEKRFDLTNRTLDDCRKYNLWIMREGFSDYAIHSCQECGKNFFRRDKAECICEVCEDKNNFRILIRYCNGNFDTRIYKNHIDAYKDMESEIREEATSYLDIYENIDIKEGYDDGTVTCHKYYGFVSGNTSQEDVYWEIQTFNINQIIKQDNKVEKILKNKSLTEYDKLRWGEEHGAENVEIAILDVDGSIPKDLSKHGCACSSREGNVNIYYGKENGSDDKTITIKTFNEKIKVTNINFI